MYIICIYAYDQTRLRKFGIMFEDYKSQLNVSNVHIKKANIYLFFVGKEFVNVQYADDERAFRMLIPCLFTGLFGFFLLLSICRERWF